ncbi:uncharacterized protein LOC126370756 [Pectinophora gossypiella]|uniref:uncharacterized protein LOC126370756 n=1 Tax=Pectinophora gossypiella TaxID=13191 RepID=UPI00214F090F|nr:uncharacterized protein LOC126370756 [Pectinophora gossypiella]
MIKVYVIILCYTSLIAFLLVDFGEANDNAHLRPKRYLSFKNNTRFFLRLNFKANMVPWNQIFAQALGFRMNWDEAPDSFHPYHHFQRRSVYNSLEILMDKNGLNGYHCIRRAICEMRQVNEPREIYHRILKMVFSQKSSATEKWHNATREECIRSINLCPLSLLQVSLYTDL